MKRKPDFNNLLAVLKRERPGRPTLFEFFLNDPMIERLTGEKHPQTGDPAGHIRFQMKGFEKCGYDYVTAMLPGVFLPRKESSHKASVSLNEAPTITNRKDFDSYSWKAEWSTEPVVRAGKDLPHGMKIIAFGPGGLLENAIWLMGFDNLCYALADDPGLVEDMFTRLGELFERYYTDACSLDAVGACIVNDDWGYKTQTMLSTRDMRKYVIPWHKRIVGIIHASGRPAILHSCGQLSAVMDDIIDVIGYDGKHSYEDAIMPVEKAWTEYSSRIAVLGGIDVDFIIRSDEKAIKERCRKMMDKKAYALGSGNSIAPYVPDDKYLAMISVVAGG